MSLFLAICPGHILPIYVLALCFRFFHEPPFPVLSLFLDYFAGYVPGRLPLPSFFILDAPVTSQRSPLINFILPRGSTFPISGLLLLLPSDSVFLVVIHEIAPVFFFFMASLSFSHNFRFVSFDSLFFLATPGRLHPFFNIYIFA